MNIRQTLGLVGLSILLLIALHQPKFGGSRVHAPCKVDFRTESPSKYSGIKMRILVPEAV